MSYQGLGVAEAASMAIRNGEIVCGGGSEEFCGGLIAIDREGNIAMPYNSAGMYRGSVTSDDLQPKVAVWEE